MPATLLLSFGPQGASPAQIAVAVDPAARYDLANFSESAAGLIMACAGETEPECPLGPTGVVTVSEVGILLRVSDALLTAGRQFESTTVGGGGLVYALTAILDGEPVVVESATDWAALDLTKDEVLIRCIVNKTARSIAVGWYLAGLLTRFEVADIYYVYAPLREGPYAR